MPTNAAATGSWSIQQKNNARQGRALVQSAYLAANAVTAGDSVPMTTARSGVICTADGSAGVLDLRVSVSAGLVLNVKSGAAIINRAGQGPYEGWLLAPVTVTQDVANASNPRNDLIVMRIYDAAQGDTVPGTGPCQIEVITGTPAAIPSDPPITGLANGGVCLVLARAQLAANGATATITDLRKSTAPIGGVRVLLPGDLLTDASFLEGDLRWNGSSLDVWSGNAGAWQNIQSGPPVGGEYRASSAQTCPTGANTLTFGSTIQAANGITWNGSNQFTVITAGVYAVSAFAKVPFVSGNSWSMSIAGASYPTTGPGELTGDDFSAGTTDISNSATRFLAAGAKVSAYLYNNGASAALAFAARAAEFSVWKVA